MRNFLLGAVCSFALVGAVAIVALPSSHPQAADSETYRELSLFGDVFQKVKQDYVDPVKDKELINAAINGMLASLDPHSNYLDAQDAHEMDVQMRGEFGGLGIEVTMEDSVIKVVSPIDDTPAAHAGLRSGDLITRIDGHLIMGMSLSDAIDKMRGPVGSKITLTVIRHGVAKPFEVTLTRAVITVQSVRSNTEGKVGYIRITTFTEQTEPGLRRAIAKLKKDIGPGIQGYVLDLRNNPGGLLNQAVAAASNFLNGGEVVSIRGRQADDIDRFNAKAGGDLTDGKPLVVLINGGSASASEIVAGALQDHHRAILLGTRSFGKGSVQTIINIPGHGELRLTTARYFTPSGRSIQAKGITPDIIVHQAKIEEIDDTDRLHESDLPNHLPGTPAPANANSNSGTKPTDTTTPPNTTAQAAQALTNKDYQLQQALDLLHGIAIMNERRSD